MKLNNLLDLPLFNENTPLKYNFSKDSFLVVMPCLHDTSEYSKELFLIFCTFIKNSSPEEKIKGAITFTYDDLIKYSKDLNYEKIPTICKDLLNITIGNLASKIYELHNLTIDDIYYDNYKFTLIKYFKEEDRYFIKLDEIAYHFSKNNTK